MKFKIYKVFYSRYSSDRRELIVEFTSRRKAYECFSRLSSDNVTTNGVPMDWITYQMDYK